MKIINIRSMTEEVTFYKLYEIMAVLNNYIYQSINGNTIEEKFGNNIPFFIGVSRLEKTFSQIRKISNEFTKNNFQNIELIFPAIIKLFDWVDFLNENNFKSTYNLNPDNRKEPIINPTKDFKDVRIIFTHPFSVKKIGNTILNTVVDYTFDGTKAKLIFYNGTEIMKSELKLLDFVYKNIWILYDLIIKILTDHKIFSLSGKKFCCKLEIKINKAIKPFNNYIEIKDWIN